MLFKKKPIEFTEFNIAQINIANNYVELATAEILRDTIGNGWNRRQKSLINMLGLEQLARRIGEQVQDKLISVWEDELIKKFEVTRPVVRKDIDEIISFGMLVKEHINGSKRDKTLRMTAIGYTEWLEYNEQLVELYVETGKAIENAAGAHKPV